MRKPFVAAILFVPIAIPASVAVMRHHVPVALSHVRGAEIMTEVKLFLGTPQVGVPPYKVTAEEFEGVFDLAPGSSFTVTTRTAPPASALSDGKGGSGGGRGRGRGDDGRHEDDEDHRGHGRGRNAEQTSRVTFRRSQFQDIHNATPDEIIDAINEQLTNAEVYEDNGHLVLVGDKAGSEAVLEVANRSGTPLTTLAMPVEPTTGATPVELVLSIPEGDDPALQFAGHRYRILVSATAGSGSVDGASVPFVPDALTATFDAMAVAGTLPGFRGTLDGNDDSAALLTPDAVLLGVGATVPAQLFLAYIVYDANDQPEYVSNAFAVTLIP